MYKICQTEHSANRQRELEIGLMQLMLKRRFEDITVSDLCEHMAIPRKCFYRYFSGKDGALFALLDHTLEQFFNAPPGPRFEGEGSAIGDLDLFFQFWYQRKPFLDALSRSSLSGLLVERAYSFALREGHIPHHIKSWAVDIQGLAMSFSICGLMSMILQWHRQNFLTPVKEMVEFATLMLTQPLLNR